MFKGIIYKYTSPSGKVYIGQTRNWLAKFVKVKIITCSETLFGKKYYE